METKFTRGPWEIKSFNKSKEIRRSIDDGNGNNIADAWALNDITFLEMEANARLIAAAPELFTALQMVKEFVECGNHIDEEIIEAVNKSLLKAIGLSK